MAWESNLPFNRVQLPFPGAPLDFFKDYLGHIHPGNADQMIRSGHDVFSDITWLTIFDLNHQDLRAALLGAFGLDGHDLD